ncbi:MAG: S8 family serine peptidase [Chloroflexales bacterium]
MRRNTLYFWLPLLLIVLPLAATPATAHEDGSSQSYRSTELIVKLKPWADPTVFAESAGLRLQSRSNSRIPGRPIYRFDIADGATPIAKATALASNAAVAYVEPNYVGQVPEATRRSSWVVGSDAGAYVAQWAAAQINLPAAHAISKGTDVIVAILDTGIDLTHPALANRLVPGYDFIGGDDTPQEEGDASSGAFGHGTHVAGLVALTAPEARIMPLRTLDSDGSGDLWTQVVALRYAADHGAEVINLSFSFGQRSQLFDDVVADVSCSATGYTNCRSRRQPGAVVVAAAGNTGARTRAWPGASSVPGIVGVAASTAQDTLATFSTYGGQIMVAAPGEGITSSVPGGGYATWSGTSMAAPFVSGVAALIRANEVYLRPIDVIQRIAASNAEIDGPVHGRLDAAAVLSPGP